LYLTHPVAKRSSESQVSLAGLADTCVATKKIAYVGVAIVEELLDIFLAQTASKIIDDISFETNCLQLPSLKATFPLTLQEHAYIYLHYKLTRGAGKFSNYLHDLNVCLVVFL
jgi:hypothetical protein